MGDPDAFYAWSLDQQERVLGWYRAKHTPKPKPTRKGSFQGREGDRVSPSGASFWGLT